MENITKNKSNKPMSQALKDAQKRYYENNKDKIVEKRKEYNRTHNDILSQKKYYEK